MKKWLVIALVAAMSLSACSTLEQEDQNYQPIPSVLGPNDKADNFRSESAQEYFVRGTTSIVLDDAFLEATEDARLQRVKELIPYKHVVIGYFLNTYLIDKAPDTDNKEYGGLKALTKNGSYENLGIEKIGELEYAFEFVHEVGGQLDLLQALARNANAQPQEDGSYLFELAVGHITNDEMMKMTPASEWFRSAPWSSFSTDSVDESRWYWQELSILPQPRSNDAWIDYDRLFVDGVLRIGAFFGWDYHGEYHRKHARSTYDWLLRQGFKSPVQNWEDYATNRGKLTRTIVANGKEIDVEITLWWGEPGTSTDPDTDDGGRVLEAAMVESFRVNEVTMFSGHSGPWYGFALANWRKTSEGEVDASDIPFLDMPENKYQLVLAEGCDTYALGEAFWMNPIKADRQNLDIITTTSFSDASSSSVVTNFLEAVLGTDRQGNHMPMRYGKLLQKLDSGSFWFKTMYGVHGIDNNPQAHPYANTAALCKSCDGHSECGSYGNRCLNLEGSQVCSFECTTNEGCPAGYTCRETSIGSWLSEKFCVPSTYSCDDIPTPTGPMIVINEVLADPPMGEAGDINGNGERSARDDEFIELYNRGNQPVDLAGWSIWDNVTVRFTFPYNSVIEPGGYLVVFGGGDPRTFTGLPEGVPVFASKGLFLNNTGDQITLYDAQKNVVDVVRYGSEGGRSQTLVRANPDDPENPALKPSTAPPTPGAANP